LPTVEIKDYNVMIDGRNLFDQPVKTTSRAYDDLRKLTKGKDMTTQLEASWITSISKITTK